MTRTSAVAGRLLAASLVIAFALQCVLFVRANSQTYDEALTLASGALLLRGGPEVNGEHPPLARVLAALPVVTFADPPLDLDAWRARRESAFGLGRAFLYEGGGSHVGILRLGRAPMVLSAILLVGLTALFALRLWGARAGLLALVLAAFDPNLVAHGSLASHDGLLTLFVTLACFLTMEFFARPKTWRLALIGLALGCAALTKFSGAAFVLAIGVAFVVQAMVRGSIPVVWFGADGAPAGPRGARAATRALGNLALAFGVTLLVVRVAYGSTYGAEAYGAYWAGVRAQLAHQAYGHPAYFLGQVSSQGWAAYFPVALLVKCPPLLVVLAALSIAAFRKGAPFGNAAYAVLLPAGLVLLSLLFSRVDIGVRYALPLVPLLIVAASRAATMLGSARSHAPARKAARMASWALAVGLIHHVVAAVRVAPHQLAFFSDLVGGPRHGSKLLADSNLDWGQDLGTLANFTREHPGELTLAYFGTASIDAFGIRYRPAPNSCPHPPPLPPRAPVNLRPARRFLAISAMNQLGVFFGDPSAYRWLDSRTPFAVLGHSIAVYDITGDAPAHRALAALYARVGPRGYAEEELMRAAAIDEIPR